ncbi:MAG: TetR/AcrR family transcriptional regulator [Treponema sp.]
MEEKILVNKESLNTKAKILLAAKQEFFEKGFSSANVRSIAEKAGLTTGALYNLFKNKNTIFDALVKNVFDAFMELIRHTPSPDKSSYNMKTSDLSTIMAVSRVRFLGMVDFFFENWDAMNLIICRSRGSSYEHSIDNAIEFIETETLCWLQYDGIKITRRIRFFIHVMVSSHFENLKEIFYHNLTKQEAIEYVLDFNIYHCAGWKQYWMEQVNREEVPCEELNIT